MEHKITVNNFKVSFFDDGYPLWMDVVYRPGTPDAKAFRIHHAEVKDLEYALGRIRDEVRASRMLHDKDKWEA